jgi:GntR family transcriptional regulator
MQPVDLSDPRSAYEQIADDLRERIRDGRLEPGTRLPGQKEMADGYGVALETLRKAVAALVQEGLLATRSTRGTYVVRKPGEPEPDPHYQRLAEMFAEASDRIGALEARVDAMEGGRRDGRP